MNKTFLSIIGIGIVVLVVFSMFIFGIIDLSPAPKAETVTRSTMGNAQTQPDGLKIEDLKVGTGPAVKSGDTVEINYVGSLTDGKKFDASADHGGPFTTQIGVGQVIKGWDEGVVGMKVGGKRKLTIPPSLGYGSQDMGIIPPNSTLIFEVELVAIK